MASLSNSNGLCNVFVTGDIVMDRYIYEGRQRKAGSKIRLGLHLRETPGGAALLHELLQKIALKQSKIASKQPTLSSVACGFDHSKKTAFTSDSYCVMRPFPKKSGSKEEVWRMDDPLGFGSSVADLDLATVDKASLAADHQLVVMDDAGLLFRRWPARNAWPRFLLEAARPLPEWIVIKMSAPVASGDLWHTLVSGMTQDNVPQKVRADADLKNRTIAVISINDLRVEPIHVARNLSWERAALDLIQELTRNPRLTGLQRVRFLIVSLDTDGALIAEFPMDGQPCFRLVFDAGRLEGEFEASIPGNLFGYQSCLTAALVSQLVATKNSDPKAIESIERGVRTGLCTMRRLLVHGHGSVADSSGHPSPQFPIDALADEIVAPKDAWLYGAKKIPADEPRSDPWTIIAADSTPGVPLWGLARRVALRGKQELQQTPYLEFGKLFSIERTEIESLRTLQRLMTSYQDDREAKKPLSIAAFGPPGAGKSFGVEELAKGIFPDSVLLKFNLSQFGEASELHGLFHRVRDEVLQGKLPIVFWDEFDSRDLYWLQYLLAPMQDGSFQDGQITHPLGKCVFVFAGGTRSRYEEFGEPPADLNQAIAGAQNDASKMIKLEERRDALQAEYVAKKAKDFRSRLAGYLNVLGPNPRDGEDITFPVRRAVLLRMKLGVKPGKKMIIDPGLLAAFLKIKEYKHGSRSLEKIAEQVRLASRTKEEFTRSDLPSQSQLDLHVDAQVFLDILERET
jgi:hypothetical protein